MRSCRRPVWQARIRANCGVTSESAAVTFHPTKKISILGEVEIASSGGAYFRTSLYNYRKARAQARYQATASLSFSADFNLLDNQNPLPGINYDYRARQESLSFLWAPKDGKIWDFQGSYSRSAVYSNIGYLEPEVLTSQQSLLSRKCAHGHGPVQRQPAKLCRTHSQDHGRRFFLHLFRQPSHQLLPARRKAASTSPQEFDLVCGMELLRIWRGLLSLRRIPNTSAHDGIEVDTMTRFLLFGLVSIAGVQAATVAVDSERGEQLFVSLSCIQCHSVNGKGGKVAADLGRRIDRNFTPAALAATMWNHAPTMWGAMRERQISAGDLDEQAAADLFAYFYSARFFDKPGDAGRGKELFSSKRCAECHGLETPRSPRPSLSRNGNRWVTRSSWQARCGIMAPACARSSISERCGGRN